MDWTERAKALNGLSRFSLRFADDGRWIASVENAEIGGKGTLLDCVGFGEFPSHAVARLWLDMTELEPGLCIVIDAMKETRRHVRWNGFWWQDCKMPGWERQLPRIDPPPLQST